jgi:hypothetical protein
MLPGSTYRWRVRLSAAPNSIGQSHASWSAWSIARSFITPRPSAAGVTLAEPAAGASVVGDATPTLRWVDSNPAMFYYEVQLSRDPAFNTDPATATAAVYWNLVHGGLSTPPNSWTVPEAFALTPGPYHWRARQRVQATPAGASEPGIPWSAPQQFVVR